MQKHQFQSKQPPTDDRSHYGGSSSGQNAPGRLMVEGEGRRSVREKFNVDTQTGGVSLQVPIQTSPGCSGFGFGPSLGLAYSSGSAAGNGVFGLGWHLSGAEAISRQTLRSIPVYNNDTDSVHSRVGELIPVVDAGGCFVETIRGAHRIRTYRPRVEGDPMRIEYWIETDHPNRIHWRAITSENITTIYGKVEQARISRGADDGGAERTFSWLACATYDGQGNEIVYEYKAEDESGVRPELDVCCFDYGEHDEFVPSPGDKGIWPVRPDLFSVCNGGFELRTYRVCRHILMFHHFEKELGMKDCLVAATAFQYTSDATSQATFLQSCTILGYSPTSQAGAYESVSLPPTEFKYCKALELEKLQAEELHINLSGLSMQGAQWVDFNGDGAPGVLVDIPSAR
ncbi:hypothetical protein EYZ11_010773 [Aspergillus tanneri]|uniref:Uncharacterized protein n=1 Tax=Aspergillus tanneri TaxID=1220188 RepID=A0A4S3J4S5_9EURO|nr:hypothetical protein EYZ11_010773 [Aspergillus tanneri]